MPEQLLGLNNAEVVAELRKFLDVIGQIESMPVSSIVQPVIDLSRRMGHFTHHAAIITGVAAPQTVEIIPAESKQLRVLLYPELSNFGTTTVVGSERWLMTNTIISGQGGAYWAGERPAAGKITGSSDMQTLPWVLPPNWSLSFELGTQLATDGLYMAILCQTVAPGFYPGSV